MDLPGLRAVFFDIGGTPGEVVSLDGTRRLQAYETSRAPRRIVSVMLGSRTGVITDIPDDMNTTDVRTMHDAAASWICLTVTR